MFARSFAWLRRHPQLVDLLWVMPLLAISLAVTGSYTIHSGAHRGIPWYAYVPIVLALCVPLIWRRRWPRAVFAAVALAAFLQWLTKVEIGPVDAAVLVALYTVAADCAFRWSIAAGMVAEFGALLAVMRFWVDRHAARTWATVIPYTITVGAMWLWGRYVSTRRKYTRSLEERAERLERQRDAQVQVAAAAERARIAREMHDVIAHSISVMVVQADGASFTIATDPERARRAMEAIGATGRQALTEMRRMLGVLRDGRDAGTYAPQPGVDQLTELVEQIRSAGLQVDLTVGGVPAELPAALQLTIYRIVQEALTNTRKHAGPAVRSSVALHYGDQAVEVRVRDDGRGAAAADDGRGHGVLGMRERVALYGGSIHTGPVSGGGWEVLARLPVTLPANAGQNVG